MFGFSNVRIIIVLTALRPISVTLALVALTLTGFFNVFKHIAAQDQQNHNNDPTTFLSVCKNAFGTSC
jgi:hypothetical protein